MKPQARRRRYICAVCDGPAHRRTNVATRIGEEDGDAPLLHLNVEDWEEAPHDVVSDESVLLRVLATTGRGMLDPAPFIASWDVDAHDGIGEADLTGDVERAHRFADFTEAMTAWHTRSTVRPVRAADGKPNRPLTAYTVEVVRYADARWEPAR